MLKNPLLDYLKCMLDLNEQDYSNEAIYDEMDDIWRELIPDERDVVNRLLEALQLGD